MLRRKNLAGFLKTPVNMLTSKHMYFTTPRYILFTQAVRQSDVGYLEFVLAPLPEALLGGEPRIYEYIYAYVSNCLSSC